MTHKSDQDPSHQFSSPKNDAARTPTSRGSAEQQHVTITKDKSDYINEALEAIYKNKIRECRAHGVDGHQCDFLPLWENELRKLQIRMAKTFSSSKNQNNAPTFVTQSKTESSTSRIAPEDEFEMTEPELAVHFGAISQAREEVEERKLILKKKYLEDYKSLSMTDRVAFVNNQTPDDTDWMKMGWDDLFDLVSSSIGDEYSITPDMAAFIGHPNLSQKWVREVIDDGSDEEYRLLYKNRGKP